VAKKHRGWDNPPPVSMVGGSETFLAQRMLTKAIHGARATNRRVEISSEKGVLEDAVSASILYPESMLLVVRDLKVLDPEYMANLASSKDNTVALLVAVGGPLPAKGHGLKVVEVVPKDYRFVFSKPPPWKEAEVCTRFLLKEAASRGKTLPEPLATALVNRVSTDLGVLRFEMLKLSTYLDGLGETEVKPAHVAAVMSRVGSANFQAVVDAVGAGDTIRALRALDEVYLSSNRDPTLRAIAWVSKSAATWLHAASLDGQGASEDEVSSRMGINPYRYTHFVLPVARRWGTSRLMSLLHRLAEVQQSVGRGCADPWTRLECVLVLACRSISSPR
jgi:DNA polymerase III delta subunit